MKLNSKLSLLVVALPLLMGMVRDDSYDFKALPKPGDKADFKESVSFSIQAQDVLVETTLHQTIDAVSDTGNIDMTQTESDTSIKVGGQPAQAPDSKVQKLKFLADGELKEAVVEGTDANWYRLFNLSVFLHPDKAVKVGESWTKTLEANKTTGAVPISATYTVVAAEKVGPWPALKVKYQIKETGVDSPGTGEGTLWISLADSQVVQEEGSFKNAPFPGSAMPLDATVKLLRIK